MGNKMSKSICSECCFLTNNHKCDVTGRENIDTSNVDTCDYYEKRIDCTQSYKDYLVELKINELIKLFRDNIDLQYKDYVKMDLEYGHIASSGFTRIYRNIRSNGGIVNDVLNKKELDEEFINYLKCQKQNKQMKIEELKQKIREIDNMIEYLSE